MVEITPGGAAIADAENMQGEIPVIDKQQA